jgi:hypothetical protein
MQFGALPVRLGAAAQKSAGPELPDEPPKHPQTIRHATEFR